MPVLSSQNLVHDVPVVREKNETGGVLVEGRNRQIRRMCQVLGYRVLTLHRVRIMHVRLDGLVPGKWKPLTEEERAQLFQAVGRGSGRGDTRIG